MISAITTTSTQSSDTIADGSKNWVETSNCRIQRHPASSLVSVIIPTLHRPALLMRALVSVFHQTWRELEVIVVVDGPDPTRSPFFRLSMIRACASSLIPAR